MRRIHAILGMVAPVVVVAIAAVVWLLTVAPRGTEPNEPSLVVRAKRSPADTGAPADTTLAEVETTLLPRSAPSPQSETVTVETPPAIAPSADPAAEAIGPVDAAELRLLAEAHRRNRQLVGTWRGSASIDVVHEDPGGTSGQWQAQASFVCDQGRDSKRWSWSYTNALRRNDAGQLVRAEDILEMDRNMTRVVTPEGQMTPSARRAGRGGNLVAPSAGHPAPLAV